MWSFSSGWGGRRAGMVFSASARLDTLRHAGVRRLLWRARREISYRLVYPGLAPRLFKAPPLERADKCEPMGRWTAREAIWLETAPRERVLAQAEDLLRHGFRFLNLPPVDIDRPVRWGHGHEDPLWRYCLHCGEWTLVLAQAYLTGKQEGFKEAMIRLMEDWVVSNPPGSRPGWEPYPISRRLVAWSRVAMAMGQDPAFRESWKRRLAPSMWQQARLLEATLEKDLDNNHLVANYRALAWMGLLFPHWPRAERWRHMGLGGLWTEMRRQVLPDGCHDERSISYHTAVLQDLMETWAMCGVLGEAVPKEVRSTLESMLQFLADMQAPDGTYPMLNDTVPGYPLDPRSLLLAGGLLLERADWLIRGRGGDPSYAAWLTGGIPAAPAGPAEEPRPEVSAYPKAGYLVLRGENGESLWFDAGPMGPRHLPGHGHADALSVSLFARGRWLIVDPGVYSYHDAAWRDRFRATSSHNTVTVDGKDQCVFWGPFRVAYPPEARLLDWSGDHGFGEHDGYKRLGDPVVHRRKVERKGNGAWEIRDEFQGRGEHAFCFTLQMAEGASARAEGAGCTIRWPGGVCMEVICASPPAGAEARVEPGWVSPGWNIEEEAPRYVLRWRARVPCECAVSLRLSGP